MARDPEPFNKVVGDLLREHVSAGRAVQMAMLWDSGRVGAAVLLEQLWNNLSDPVSCLLCAYPASSVNHVGAAEPFERVRALHARTTEADTSRVIANS
jgi:hypothetical protein